MIWIVGTCCAVRRLLAAACAALAWISAAPALDPALAITQYSHRAWLAGDSEADLPQNSVFSILQTQDGYLWLATQEGLVRFDGARFVVFNSRNTDAIRHNDVWKLLEDRSGALWIGTRGGGVVRYRDGVFENLSREQGLSNDSVQALWEDADGSLWIGTRGGGLNRYRDGRFTALTSRDGLPNDTVYAVHGDRAGNLWIGTDGGGLALYRDGRFSVFSTKNGLSNDTVYAIHEDRDGALWVGTGAGLNRIVDGRVTVFGTKDGLSNENIRALTEDRAGNLWIGTDGGGLDRYRNGRFEAFTTQQGLSNDSIGAIYEDREGNLWVGTDAGGLNRLKDSKFVPYTVLEGLSDDNARAVLESRDGSLWIGTFGGLNHYRDGRFDVYTTRDGLSNDVVLSLCEGRDGSLWAGTLGGGLNRFKDGRFTAYGKADGLTHETVLSLHEDRNGTLWIGTRSGGLNRLDRNGRIRAYTTQDGLGANDVRVIHEGRDGTLWIGTLAGGLNRFDGRTFTVHGKKDGLSNDLVLSIHEDAEGVLWIGTFGGGLNRFKDGRFTAYTSRDGLFDDAVFQILEDGDGRLWMSSNRGIFRVDKRQLDAFAGGHIAVIESVAYGKADGMKSQEANGAHQPAGWKSRDGRLWFPTIRGIVTIDPAGIRINTQPPPVVIEQFLVDGERLPVSQAIVLPPGRRKLEFRFTALSYQAPEKVQFQYRLDGFDEAWVNGGTVRNAYYTNIPPGDYRFRVRASNNDGVWNETGAALDFRLAPHFYETRAFYLVYVLAAALLVALGFRFHRVRVRQLQARERELLTLVSERRRAEAALKTANTALAERAAELARSNAELERFAYVASHDLKEPLRSVISFTQLLEKKYKGRLDAEADSYIQFAVDGAKSMRGMIENLLDYARIASTERTCAATSADEALHQALKNLRAAVEHSGAVVTHAPLPDVQARPTELVQLFQNLIDNAIKFRSDAPPRIHLSAQREKDAPLWRFCVADNGIGIEPRYADKVFRLFQRLHHREDYPGTGIGLAVCKKIVESAGGRIWVEAADGPGARIVFTLPAVPPAAAAKLEVDTPAGVSR